MPFYQKWTSCYKKTNTIFFYLYEVSKVIKFIGQRMEVTRNCEEGTGSCLMGTELHSVLLDKESPGDRLHNNEYITRKG